MSLLAMNKGVASIFWTTCFFCAGSATYVLAQSSAPPSSDKGCVGPSGSLTGTFEELLPAQ